MNRYPSPSRSLMLSGRLLACVAAAGSALGEAVQQTDTKPATTLGPDLTPQTPPGPGVEPLAADAPAAPEAPPKGAWLEALTGGTFDLNLRLRYEFAEVGTLGDANAFTLRTRLGYTTDRFAGFQAGISLEDNRAADYDQYNAAGLNGQPGLSVVADPQDSELDQLWIDYDLGELFTLGQDQAASVRIGRQRIILDDARFVGNVGWRNLEQTFDAGVLKLTPAENLDLFYGYVTEVNRIFGPDSGRDFDSDSHLLNATLKATPIGAIAGFAYLLDFEDATAFSSQTYGARVNHTLPLDDGLKLGYAGSVAWQSDYGENPTGYEALYFAAEGRLISSAGVFGGLGFESLGSDDGVASFQTPLATGHAFNGFADVFLVTPAAGLRDYYAFAGTSLPAPYKGKLTAFYHVFTEADSSNELGYEIDLVAAHKFNENLTGLVKYAYFDGEGVADVQRLWLQMELEF